MSLSGQAMRRLLLATALLLSPPALGQPASHEPTSGENLRVPEPPERSARPSWLPAAAAAIPGLAAHGAGLFAAGDRSTALRLLAAEGAGAALIAAGAVPIGLTRATGASVGPALASTVIGAGLFALSWAADLYGAATGGRPGARAAPDDLPRVDVAAGLAYVYDPQFAYRAFSGAAAEARLGALRAAAAADLALDRDNRRLRFETAWRLARGHPGDGSFIDLQAALTWHDYGSDGFSLLTPELSLPARLDLARVGPSLAGAFAELSLGVGVQSTTYASAPGDADALLLARFGFGLYIPRGEVVAYYDHRHDGFAGGLALGGHENTVLGHFGLAAAVDLGAGFGAGLELQAGSAYVGRLAVRYRLGGRP